MSLAMPLNHQSTCPLTFHLRNGCLRNPLLDVFFSFCFLNIGSNLSPVHSPKKEAAPSTPRLAPRSSARSPPALVSWPRASPRRIWRPPRSAPAFADGWGFSFVTAQQSYRKDHKRRSKLYSSQTFLALWEPWSNSVSQAPGLLLLLPTTLHMVGGIDHQNLRLSKEQHKAGEHPNNYEE